MTSLHDVISWPPVCNIKKYRIAQRGYRPTGISLSPNRTKLKDAHDFRLVFLHWHIIFPCQMEFVFWGSDCQDRNIRCQSFRRPWTIKPICILKAICNEVFGVNLLWILIKDMSYHHIIYCEAIFLQRPPYRPPEPSAPHIAPWAFPPPLKIASAPWGGGAGGKVKNHWCTRYLAKIRPT